MLCVFSNENRTRISENTKCMLISTSQCMMRVLLSVDPQVGFTRLWPSFRLEHIRIVDARIDLCMGECVCVCVYICAYVRFRLNDIYESCTTYKHLFVTMYTGQINIGLVTVCGRCRSREIDNMAFSNQI